MSLFAIKNFASEYLSAVDNDFKLQFVHNNSLYKNSVPDNENTLNFIIAQLLYQKHKSVFYYIKTTSICQHFSHITPELILISQ